MGTETERKFLVRRDEWNRLEKPRGEHYRQGYVLNDNDRAVRIRVTADKAFITLKKTGESNVSRHEFEYEIPVSDGEEMLKLFTSIGTEKLRYFIPVGKFTWEVDEFLGDNKGLIVAEIELENEDDAFEKPGWLAEEVTDDDRYANSSLAEKPYKDW